MSTSEPPAGLPLELNPQIIRHQGEPAFVVLPYDEYRALEELLEDLDDLVHLRRAKEEAAGEPMLSLEEVRRELGLG
jgi:PHD/YefM family antitoxin component YafN of YafNO toxin-antitoxin module